MCHRETNFYNEWYKNVIPEIKKISAEFGIPIVGTWDSHYLCEDDKEAHDTLLKINTNSAEFKMDGNWSFIDEKKALEEFAEIPEAVENTMGVADLVDIDIDTTSWFFPAFPIDANTTFNAELIKLVEQGYVDRKIQKTPEITERVEFELKIISDKGYSSYFLCVADFINNATRMGIFNQTRGSAAGSMVSYLVGISNINPIEYGLLFERFLNPDRPSLPDIDMDFADTRRDEIIDYAKSTADEFDKIVGLVRFFPFQETRSSIFENIQDALEKVITTRQELTVFGTKTLSAFQWLIFFALAAFVIFSLY